MVDQPIREGGQQRHLRQERAFQEQPWYLQLSHLLLQADSQLWQDTLRNYGYVVPLKQAAIFCGVAVGLFASLLGDLLLSLLLLPFRQRQPAPRRALR